MQDGLLSLADELAPPCQHCDGPTPCKPCSKFAVRPGLSRRGNLADVTLPVGADTDRIRSMLEARGLDPERWTLKSVTVNEWEGFHTADGETIVVPLHQTKATLTYDPPPEETSWGRFCDRLATLTTPARIPARRLKPPKTRPLVWVLFGDDQAPFVNWPLHETFCEFLTDLQPDGLIHMGDLADLPDISRHSPKRPGSDFAATVTRCVDVAHRITAERVQAAGEQTTGRRILIMGNHDIRFDKILLERLPQLFGLRQATTPTDPDPAHLLTVHHLARLADLGFEQAKDTRGDYPYGFVQVADHLIATHGWKALRGAGNSARASIEHLNSGIAVGHTHRVAVTHETRWTPDGEPIVYTAAETGTLADPRGLGYTGFPDWQPGFVTVTVHPDGTHHVDPALWRNSILSWRGQAWHKTARGVRRS